MIFELSRVLRDVDVGNYSRAPLLSEMDYVLISAVGHYEGLDSRLKQVFREEISREAAGVFLILAERVAGYLIDVKDQKLFRLGLMTLDACMERVGNRDVFPLLSLYYDVYKRHLFVFEELLELEEPMGKALQAFLLKEDEEKSIGAMGYCVRHNTLGQAFFVRV